MIRTIFTRYIPVMGALGLIGFAILFVNGQDRSVPPPAPMAPPPESPFATTVAGAGIVEAETENISIGSPTPGVVTKVLVKVDQRVQAGDELFELDGRMLQAELRSRQAMLAAAQAEVTRMENEPRPEQLRMAEAQLTEAQANQVNQRDQLTRGKELFNRKVETAENLVARQQALHVADAQVAKAQAEYEMRKNGAWKFDLDVARAAVTQAEAQVEQIKTELDRLTIRALVAGRVLQVNVRPGEFVGAPPGQALIVLGNIDQMHVRVDIDEHDIPRFVPGADGIAMVRGRAANEYPLKFVRVEPYVVPKRSLTGDNTERVDTRVLQVIYAIDPQGQPLYVGQQLDVYIKAPPDTTSQDAAKKPAAKAG